MRIVAIVLTLLLLGACSGGSNEPNEAMNGQETPEATDACTQVRAGIDASRSDTIMRALRVAHRLEEHAVDDPATATAR